MSKRSWSVANAAQGLLDMNAGHRVSPAAQMSISPSQKSLPPPTPSTAGDRPNGPQISRKVKACAACRKQKIKCLMDNGEPPCRRCIERKLSCVLNKSLQTLINEGSQWQDDMRRDLGNIHSALSDLLKHTSLPPLPALQTRIAAQEDQDDTPEEEPSEVKEQHDVLGVGPSVENSPKVTPRHESLQNVPIETLYEITRLRSLRGEEASAGSSREERVALDVISKGILSLDDAERLARLYLCRLDHFAYSITNRFPDLGSIRRRSAMLTAAICTVAALHDPESNHIFDGCYKEFKRLLSETMFDRRIDRETLRAMCIGAYWLSDISWTLSGHAIRRAMAVSLSSNFERVLADNSEDAADCLRLWYFLYVCDHHLSILYGRPTIMRRDDPSILGMSRFLATPVAKELDRRLASQVALLTIMGDIRDYFGKYTNEPLHANCNERIRQFSNDLDAWVAIWHSNLKIHDRIGDFPSRGVIMHSTLAKLHLYSHVFRGLGDSQIPAYFSQWAHGAVSAAKGIIELLLDDPALRDAIVGMPHYVHTMVSFACGFLLQISAKDSSYQITKAEVHSLIGRLIKELRSRPTGNWHILHFMADGLDNMVEASKKAPSQAQVKPYNAFSTSNQVSTGAGSFGMDFNPGQGDFGISQDDAFMLPDFGGFSNSFLPFEDPNAFFKTSDLGSFI